MMSEIASPEDTVESTFEIINNSGDGNSSRQTPDAPSTGQSITADMQHPSNPSVLPLPVPTGPTALPSFAKMPTPPPPATTCPAESTVITQQQQPQHPPPPPSYSAAAAPPPQATIAIDQSSSTNPFSVRASSGGQSLNTVLQHQQHHVTMGQQAPPPQYTMPPPPPPPAANQQQFSYNQNPMLQQQQQTRLEMPIEMGGVLLQQPIDPSSGPLSVADKAGQLGSGGVGNWLNKTISGSNFLSKVAEKAKTSLDNMITTLDPQMKDYMNPSGAVELYVVSADVDVVSQVKIGFARQFPNLIVRGVPPPVYTSSTIAAQPVGFSNGLQAVKETIKAIQTSGLIDPNALILAASSFLVENNAENWLEFYCLALNNGSNVDLHWFTQPVIVPNFAMDIIKHQTQSDYALSASGFAYSLDHVMSHSNTGYMVDQSGSSSWHLLYSGLNKSELIGFACVPLAYAYRVSCLRN